MTNLLQEQVWFFGGARCLRPLIKINSKWLRQTDRVLAQDNKKKILGCTLDWHSDVVKVVVVRLIPRLEVPLRDKAEAVFPCTHIKQQEQTQSDLLELKDRVNKRFKLHNCFMIYHHHLRHYNFTLILTYVSFGDQIDQISPFSNLSFVFKVGEGVGHTAHQFKPFKKKQSSLTQFKVVLNEP